MACCWATAGATSTRLGIEHIARDTACEQLWRGIADGRSRVVFHGGIGIRAGADGTDASLNINKNLLLSAMPRSTPSRCW